jgi:hypothetical protein
MLSVMPLLLARRPLALRLPRWPSLGRVVRLRTRSDPYALLSAPDRSMSSTSPGSDERSLRRL